MFLINNDKSIYLTRGDVAVIDITVSTPDNTEYIFSTGDVVRFQVFEKGRPDVVVLTKEVNISSETSVVSISLEHKDTKIGELISKPKDYWYEIELNPDTRPQTIIGYDNNGPRIFRLFPEGGG